MNGWGVWIGSCARREPVTWTEWRANLFGGRRYVLSWHSTRHGAYCTICDMKFKFSSRPTLDMGKVNAVI